MHQNRTPIANQPSTVSCCLPSASSLDALPAIFFSISFAILITVTTQPTCFCLLSIYNDTYCTSFWRECILYMLQVFHCLPLFSKASFSTNTYQLSSLRHLSNTNHTTLFEHGYFPSPAYLVSFYYCHLCLRLPYILFLLYFIALI